MFKFTNNTFHVTNGDYGEITFKTKDGSKIGTLSFGIYEKNSLDSEPKYYFSDDLSGNNSDSFVLTIYKEDYIKFDNPENGKEEYWYELKINEKTVLGYDETGAKIFYLYPTGKEGKSE